MRVLLDSHALLWMLYEPGLLSPRVRALLSDMETELLISHVSPWELGQKAGKSKLPDAGNSPDRLLENILALGGTLVPIELSDILDSTKLPGYHSDPMDRVLIAQALRLKAPLITVDGKITRYDVPTIWK